MAPTFNFPGLADVLAKYREKAKVSRSIRSVTVSHRSAMQPAKFLPRP